MWERKSILGEISPPIFPVTLRACADWSEVNFEFLTSRLLLRNKELQNLVTRYNKHLLFSSLTVGWPGCLSNYTISSALGRLSLSLCSTGGSLGAEGSRGSCNYILPLANWLVYGSPHQGLSNQLHIQSFILLQPTPGFFHRAAAF